MVKLGDRAWVCQTASTFNGELRGQRNVSLSHISDSLDHSPLLRLLMYLPNYSHDAEPTQILRIQTGIESVFAHIERKSENLVCHYLLMKLGRLKCYVTAAIYHFCSKETRFIGCNI